MARLCLAQGQPQPALDYLKQHWQSLEKTNLGTSRIQSLIVEALARRALGQREQALLPLERALVMAQPGGFISSFIEHGAPMQELLRRAAVNSTVPLYAQKLLAAFQTPSEKDQSALTQREMEILHLLSAGLSNRQMSEQLVISEATLKRHISNLYLKLDVHSRTQALVKAAELKLL
jgi:LuxR family maltose regulon positive regulatory protein